MQFSIDTMRAKWDALQPRLKLLNTAPLTNEDFTAVLAAKEDPFSPVFLEHMPITVARFKKSAQEEIMHGARLFSTLVTQTPFANAYLSDTAAINKVLFDTRLDGEDIALGFFSTPRARTLHADGNGGPHPIYIARLGALPVWYIHHKDEMHASDEVRCLIEDASYEEGEEARQELARRGILIPLPLNDVALIFTKTKLDFAGTLHCSSVLPPEGAHSAFFHSGFDRLKGASRSRKLFERFTKLLPSHP